jgi:hypothetical protein
VDPRILAIAFLLVMGTALACFARAFSLRRDRPRHIRWAVVAIALDVVGTLVVVVTSRVLGWHVPARSEYVALVHRGFAYVATAMLVAQAVTGASRSMRAHRALGPAFLGVYAITYALAVAAYAPWP